MISLSAVTQVQPAVLSLCRYKVSDKDFIIIIWTLQYEHETYDKFGVREYQYIKW